MISVNSIVSILLVIGIAAVSALYAAARRQISIYRELSGARDEESRLFRMLHEKAADPILLVDARHRILDANDKALVQYGLPLDELRRLDTRQLRPEHARKSFEHDWARADEPGGIRFETEHQRGEGSTFPVEVSVRAIDAHEERTFQMIVRDITKRREKENQLRREMSLYRETFERCGTAMAICASDGRTVVALNGALLALLGLTWEQVRAEGLEWRHILTVDARGQAHLERSGGRRIPVELRGTEIQDSALRLIEIRVPDGTFEAAATVGE